MDTSRSHGLRKEFSSSVVLTSKSDYFP